MLRSPRVLCWSTYVHVYTTIDSIVHCRCRNPLPNGREGGFRPPLVPGWPSTGPVKESQVITSELDAQLPGQSLTSFLLNCRRNNTGTVQYNLAVILYPWRSPIFMDLFSLQWLESARSTREERRPRAEAPDSHPPVQGRGPNRQVWEDLLAF